MTAIFDDRNRQIVPRWYPYRIAWELGELASATPIEKPESKSMGEFERKCHDWQLHRRLPYAIEVVGTALLFNITRNPVATEAAEFIISKESSASDVAVQLARQYINADRTGEYTLPNTCFEDESAVHQMIASLKVYAREYPSNAVAWCDLAYYYSILGQIKHAETCMGTATYISRDNRFILRSAARCFLHLGAPDKALWLLRKSNLSKSDPWVISAEIAIAEAFKQSPKLVKRAQYVMQDSRFFPKSTSELAGTLGTLELKNGNKNKAKKLLKLSLIDPNENALAQAVWLTPDLGKEDFISGIKVIAQYEADARSFFRKKDYSSALNSSMAWLRFQPFSARPAVFGSYVASVCLRDDAKAADIIRRAMCASAESFLLQNNYAFALASIGKLDDADYAIEKAARLQSNEGERNVLNATRGLIHFRRGNIAQARELYQKAIDGFHKRGNDHSKALALLFWAREEHLHGTKEYSDIIARARELILSRNETELVDYLKSLTVTANRPRGDRK